jgi:hypothetical protein
MLKLKHTIAFTSKENEPMKQGHLINKINRLIPIANATPKEEFDGGSGIWIRGSEYCFKNRLLFEYYDFDEPVHPDLLKIIEDAGWFYEPHDAGTLMLYPN